MSQNAKEFDYNVYRNSLKNFTNLYNDENSKNVTFSFKDSDVKLKAHSRVFINVFWEYQRTFRTYAKVTKHLS